MYLEGLENCVQRQESRTLLRILEEALRGPSKVEPLFFACEIKEMEAQVACLLYP